MVATLKLRTEQLAKYRTLAGLKTDRALAERMGFETSPASSQASKPPAPSSSPPWSLPSPAWTWTTSSKSSTTPPNPPL